MTDDRPAAPPAMTYDPELEASFRALADRWAAETAGAMDMRARVSHECYQQIIGMGPRVLPLILRELRDRPNWWFWALSAVAQVDVAAQATTFGRARDIWLDWAAANGLLPRHSRLLDEARARIAKEKAIRGRKPGGPAGTRVVKP